MAYYPNQSKPTVHGTTGLFDASRDCCICYEKLASAQVLSLRCSHKICAKCLQSREDEVCPYKCRHGQFNRVAALQQLGLPIPTVPPRAEFQRPGREFRDSSGFVGKVSPLARTASPGLVTFELCENDECDLYNKEQINNAYGHGTFDMASSAHLQVCLGCGSDRTVTKLVFNNCHVQVRMCEAFKGGKKQFVNVNTESIGKTTTYPLPGHYNSLKLSTQAPSVEHLEELVPEGSNVKVLRTHA
jgi:hypothetical protein